MNASQTKMFNAIVANVRANPAIRPAMASKVAEYRRNAERDLSIARTCGNSSVSARFRKSAQTALNNAAVTEAALAEAQ